jgi:hypothetical protein
MTVTVELLVHADLGLPAGVALALSSRARADRHQTDRSAPPTPRGSWAVGKPRWPGVVDWPGLAACVVSCTARGRTGWRQSPKILGSACWICRLRSGISGSASRRSQVTGSWNEATGRPRARHGVPIAAITGMALTRIWPKRGIAALAPGMVVAVTTRAICGLRSPDTSVCSHADTRKGAPERDPLPCVRDHEGIHDVAPLRQPDRARGRTHQPL